MIVEIMISYEDIITGFIFACMIIIFIKI